ncbi:VOC family protein [Rhizobium leguminosarum]|uniref:Bleomycin resistance protein n=2 Tax=Rhizobium leguminosarum TaxID=384 RepID=A0A154IMI9_RHILE|nr:VOC family protein [Rhizobium leguminosarum]KZB01799.1 bleomycin resistance protein [Rhizobium leguminosarum]
MKLGHFALWTDDLEGAAAFWTRYFHATVGEPYHSKRRAGFVSRFVTIGDGSLQIELMTGPWIKAAPYQEAVGWDHLAISVGSEEAVDAIASRCRENGVLVSEPRTTGDGFYEAVIAMPDGTRIEITS